MRAHIAAAAAVFLLAAPSGAFAQDAALPDEAEIEGEIEAAPSDTTDAEAALADMSDKLADPDFQTQIAHLSKALVNTMLDLEVGSFIKAVDDASDGALSNDGTDIAPDARLRDMVRGADDAGDDIAEKLPQAMNTMSAMSEGFAAMLPALKVMAQQMGDAAASARTAD